MPALKDISLKRIKVESRVRKDYGDIKGLAASIEMVGLLQPVVLLRGNRLVIGERRLKAFEFLGRKTVPALIVRDLDEALRIDAEDAENVCRKGYTPVEAVAAARRRRAQTKAKAEKRMKAGVKPPGNLPEGDTRDLLAAAVGLSGKSLMKAEAVVAAGKEDKGAYGDLVVKMEQTGRIDPAFKELRMRRNRNAIENTEPPEGKYHVIVVDPPWSYEKRSGDATHRGANPYPSMSLDEIAALSVSDLADTDCILWLWTTNAFMHQAFDIADAWGFQVKTILTWAKDRFGLGDWLRGQTEHCLMCIRGKPVVVLTNQSTLLKGPMREHSRKPEEFYAMVETLCPGKKIELFSRTQRKEWVNHGAERNKFQGTD